MKILTDTQTLFHSKHGSSNKNKENLLRNYMNNTFTKEEKKQVAEYLRSQLDT